MGAPSQTLVKVQSEVFNGGMNMYPDVVNSHTWAYSSSSGERHKYYKEKKKEQYSYKTGTWNVRTLNRGGKLENLKNKMQKNNVERTR